MLVGLLSGEIEERFWDKVDCGRRGCWDWNGALTRGGYGQFSINNIPVRAHRFAWALTEAGLPPKGKEVCHECDNRRCCNPEHLFVGSRSDNMRDAWSKGRGRGFARRLSDEQAADIRLRYPKGRKPEMAVIREDMAREFGISVSYLSQIAYGHRR